ncbi:type II toxin-antitoxin system VapC family toxin [Paracoccus marinaquae]|uniref:PIN domain-containing protein n=1 Tax=Paracoccus marinaquae TaxID=2841926 RepID=A0ABS6AS94_9RHOB|nr:PIN domain-containing protein [Paracoccus marinaquae]MBU3032376.1 PIN domain-containing protein [Paracoccus marinaquae]
MILVDTSIWIDHLRNGNPGLSDRLLVGNVLCHPLIVAELALGTLKSRTDVLALLDNLPQSPRATETELRVLIEERRLYGRGIGVVDLNLVASCLLSPGTFLWTADRRLNDVAKDTGIPLVGAAH